MTTCSYPTAPGRRNRVARALGSNVARFITRRALARLDDQMLCDIGLCREDLEPGAFAQRWQSNSS